MFGIPHEYGTPYMPIVNHYIPIDSTSSLSHDYGNPHTINTQMLHVWNIYLHLP